MCEYSTEALHTANNERHFPLKTGTRLSISIILGRYITSAISPTILYSPLCGLLLTFLPPHKLCCLTSGQCHFSDSALSHKGDFTPGQAIRRCFCVLVTFILCWNLFTWQMTTENFPVLLRSTENRRHKRLWYWFPGHLNRIIKLYFPLFPLTPAVVTYAQHLTWLQLSSSPFRSGLHQPPETQVESKPSV